MSAESRQSETKVGRLWQRMHEFRTGRHLQSTIGWSTYFFIDMRCNALYLVSMAGGTHRHLALYGSVAIERQYCVDCHGYAFILDGKMACCGANADGVTRKTRRMIEAESKKRSPKWSYRKKQMERQDGKCLYCGLPLDGYVFRNGKASRIKIHWDHVVPYSYSQNNHDTNFVASCHVCNLIKSDMVFQTLEEARSYVQIKREEKGYL